MSASGAVRRSSVNAAAATASPMLPAKSARTRDAECGHEREGHGQRSNHRTGRVRGVEEARRRSHGIVARVKRPEEGRQCATHEE